MNSLFETTNLFVSYAAEHLLVVLAFVLFVVLLLRWMKTRSEEEQRKVLLAYAVLLSFVQLVKIPLNLYTGTFDITSDIPLHMCNFLRFVMVWIYISKSRKVWSVVFFWVVLGVSQANVTPSVEFSLFHYDAIRYWMVHMGLILLALYPLVFWDWDLEFKDIGRTVLWLNITAVIIYGANLLLGSNYFYVMGKPEGTTFFSILPPWPTYLIVLEFIVLIWSLMVYGVVRMFKRRASDIEVILEG